MFPWDHLAAGYLAYSLGTRLLGRRPPTVGTVLAVALGSQFPDLVDKPAGWLLGVFPTGVSVAHSVFVAVPVAVAALWVTRTRDRPELGAAFGTGYLLHLPGDALMPVVLSGARPDYSVFLWPISPKATSPPGGFLVNVEYFLSRYPELLTTLDLRLIGFEVALLGGALVFWVLDGTPGISGRNTQLPVR